MNKPAPKTDAADAAIPAATGATCKPDFSTRCPVCETQMQPEHAHYRCLRCGYRDSCCM